MEHEVKTYNFVDGVCWRVSSQDGPDRGGFSREKTSYGGSLPLRLVDTFIIRTNEDVKPILQGQKHEMNCLFVFNLRQISLFFLTVISTVNINELKFNLPELMVGLLDPLNYKFLCHR